MIQLGDEKIIVLHQCWMLMSDHIHLRLLDRPPGS